MTLPPLPTAKHFYYADDDRRSVRKPLDLFTSDQTLAYGEACAAAERNGLRAEIERLRAERKPLTAQQLDKLIEAYVGGRELLDGEYSAMVLFAAAVERAHGIGPNVI